MGLSMSNPTAMGVSYHQDEMQLRKIAYKPKAVQIRRPWPRFLHFPGANAARTSEGTAASDLIQAKTAHRGLVAEAANAAGYGRPEACHQSCDTNGKDDVASFHIAVRAVVDWGLGSRLNFRTVSCTAGTA